MSTVDIESVEVTIEELKESLDLAEALQRLQSNPDFVKVINEGYLKDNAVRLVSLKADPTQQTEKDQAKITRGIDGIGALLNYFRTIFAMASTAQTEIADHEQTLESLRNE